MWIEQKNEVLKKAWQKVQREVILISSRKYAPKPHHKCYQLLLCYQIQSVQYVVQKALLKMSLVGDAVQQIQPRHHTFYSMQHCLCDFEVVEFKMVEWMNESCRLRLSKD